jgi:hypothetical protein
MGRSPVKSLKFYKGLIVGFFCCLVKADHGHVQVRVGLQKVKDGADCDICGKGQGKPVYARADGREGYAAAALFSGKRKAGLIAALQKAFLAAAAAASDGAGRMDHILCGQVVPAGYFCLSGFAAVQRPAFRKQARARGPVYGAVHASAAKQGSIGGIYDSIGTLLCNVPQDHRKAHMAPLFIFIKVYILRAAAANAS